MSEVAIRVESLTFAWPERPPVLQACSFVIPKGQLWMLLGPNGSGKSTLLQLLSGSLTHPQPLSGHLEIRGRLGYVFQNPDHQLFMPTVGADVAFGLGAEALTLAEIHQRVETALEQVGLKHLIRRPIHGLSGGQSNEWQWQGLWPGAARCCFWTSRQPCWIPTARRICCGASGNWWIKKASPPFG